jgi:hypothetical protein
MTQTIQISVYSRDSESSYPLAIARVQGIAHHGNITTGGPCSGRPNITHYAVTIADHEFSGTWDDDARHDIQVGIDSDHPLAAAVQLLATAQKKLRELREMRGPAPIGYRASEWASLVQEASADYTRAKAAVSADPIASGLRAGA